MAAAAPIDDITSHMTQVLTMTSSASAALVAASESVCIFEPEPDMKYSCPICLGLLNRPVQTSCGHRFCKGCYRRAVRNQPLQSRANMRPICPVDKTNVTAVFEDVAVAREIQNLTVVCRRKEIGCPWNGEYRDVQSHKDTCEHEPVPCELNCAAIIKRKDMTSHVEHCPNRREPCKLCGKVILAWDLKHLFFECPDMPIPCVYCEKRLKREVINQHTDPLRGDCPAQEIPCRYSRLGCEVKCQRKDLSGHNEIHRQEHMMLMLQRIEHLENKVQTLEAEKDNHQCSSQPR